MELGGAKGRGKGECAPSKQVVRTLCRVQHDHAMAVGDIIVLGPHFAPRGSIQRKADLSSAAKGRAGVGRERTGAHHNCVALLVQLMLPPSALGMRVSGRGAADPR